MEAAERRRKPDRGIPGLRVSFKLIQAVSRFLAVLFELGTLAFIGWLYNTWRYQPSVRVDVLFPSFFPVAAAVIMDLYELISLVCLTRRWPINRIAVGFDLVLIAVGVFCFLVIGLADHGVYRNLGLQGTESTWDVDVNNAMIFMIVFTILHAYFLLLACAGYIYRSVDRNRRKNKKMLALSQAQMVEFNERQKRLTQQRPGLGAGIPVPVMAPASAFLPTPAAPAPPTMAMAPAMMASGNADAV
ncbi:hypothetical protein B0H63DRAFT_16723 [Podospora didyma]|uniref:Uncharacterized protein n=1 Tax=Podospora didyma TaxID=330526 RepID=A0AAE0P4V4_9PEZI|nr:hypothetical protein B0H63DRAFT_16723 [Podospora didyma]